MTYGIGNPGHDLGQPKICGRVKQVNGIPTLTLFIIESSSTIQIKQLKPPHIHPHSRKQHNIIKINNNKNMYSTTAEYS